MSMTRSVIAALLAYNFATADAQAYKLWNVDIDRSPAPAPDLGPAFSANANRDLSRLPLEISCIVGAYFGTVLIIGFLLLTVGRRLRKRALAGSREVHMEMVKPGNRAFDPSPTSPPIDDRHWYSPKRLKKRSSVQGSTRSGRSARSGSNLGSPGIDSVASFDIKVLRDDKRQRQDELEKLYAAALAHDEALKATASVSEIELVDGKAQDYDGEDRHEPRWPLRVVTTAPALRHVRDDQYGLDSPTSPVSTRSPVRAIYPPDSEVPPVPVSPTSPIRAECPRHGRWPSHAEPLEEYTGEASVARSVRASQVSTSSATEASSPPRKLRRSPKHINIPPVPLVRSVSEHDRSGSRTPGYRAYLDDDIASPRSDVPSTPGTYTSRRRASAARERDADTTFGQATPSTVQSQFRDNNPYRQSSPTYVPPNHLPPSQISSPKMLLGGKALSPALRSPPFAKGPPPSPWPLSPQTPHHLQLQHHSPLPRTTSPAAHSTSSKGTLGPLPFRALASTAPHHDPSLPTTGSRGLPSPGPLKTTYLERRRDMLSPGMRTGGLRTAGCMTPYSPYMPFTPLTPVTPRLATREDRDRRRREMARRAVGQEDAVREDDEVWGT